MFRRSLDSEARGRREGNEKAGGRLHREKDEYDDQDEFDCDAEDRDGEENADVHEQEDLEEKGEKRKENL